LPNHAQFVLAMSLFLQPIQLFLNLQDEEYHVMDP
jgi:hypothetical protein